MIAGGPVPELDGDATSWSSEHMLLSSIGLCLLTTFEAFAARDRIELVAWEAHVGGTVDRGENGLEFTRFTVQVEMEVSDPERARATLEDARQHCLITHALRAPVDVEARIRPPGVRKAG
jgi:organic hydroperoxide reductase OsmC/OhrA